MPLVPANDLGERTFRFAWRDFAAKHSIVLKELRESLLWLRIIIECQLGTLPEAERLRNEANELVSIFTAGMKRLRPL